MKKTHDTQPSEETIREQVRREYREEGTLRRSPFKLGSMESLIWGSESSKIFQEADRHEPD